MYWMIRSRLEEYWMKYNPHEYQKYAINFIKEHSIAAILLDMGMGKTSIVLAALNDLMFDSFEVTKVLIIAPLRVAKHTWSAEIQKWDQLRGLRYSIAVGTAAERMKALQADADIYIINRENVSWLIEKSGLSFDYDMVVIDELSSFKNWQAKRFKALMQVRPRVKRIVGLTGTPSSNGLMDLFAEYKVLDKGERLGRFISQYRSEYFVPDQTNGPIVYSYNTRFWIRESGWEGSSASTGLNTLCRIRRTGRLFTATGSGRVLIRGFMTGSPISRFP